MQKCERVAVSFTAHLILQPPSPIEPHPRHRELPRGQDGTLRPRVGRRGRPEQRQGVVDIIRGKASGIPTTVQQLQLTTVPHGPVPAPLQPHGQVVPGLRPATDHSQRAAPGSRHVPHTDNTESLRCERRGI